MNVNFEKVYLEEMVVMFLTDDELKFELEIRNITYNRDESITLKRRKLKNALREEAEGLQRVFVYRRNSREELNICRRRLERAWAEVVVRDVVPEVTKAGLLHLYNRLKLFRKTFAMQDCIHEANWIFTNTIQCYITHFVENVEQPSDSSDLLDLEGAASLEAQAAIETNESANFEPFFDVFAEGGSPIPTGQSWMDSMSALSIQPVSRVETGSRIQNETIRPVVTCTGTIPRSHYQGITSTTFSTMVTLAPTFTNAACSGPMPTIWTTPRYQVSSSLYPSRNVRFDPRLSFADDPLNPPASASTVNTSSPQFYTMPVTSNAPTSGHQQSAYYRETDSPPDSSFPNIPISTFNRAESQRFAHPTITPAVSQWSDPWDFTQNPAPTSLSSSSFPHAYQSDPHRQSTMPSNSHYPRGEPFRNPLSSQRTLPQQNSFGGQNPFEPSIPTSRPYGLFNQGDRINFPASDLSGINRPNFSFQAQTPVPSINPFQDFDFNPIANRMKSIPVVKWPMKYAGDDRGMGLNDFLWEVSDWTKSEQISEYELLRAFGNLLTGRAKMWFTSNKHRFTTYSELIANLKLTFRHPDLDHFILLDIYQRRQQKNETFLEFFLDIEKKFKSLATPVSEIEIVQAIKRNLRPEYKRAFIGRELFDLYSLQFAGQEIDATNTYLFVKPQGTAHTNAVQVAEKAMGEYANRYRERGPNTSNPANKGQAYNRVNNSSRQGQGQSKDWGGVRQWNQKEASTKSAEIKGAENIKSEEYAGDSGRSKGETNKSVKEETTIHKHVPLNDKFVCFNCHSQQHLTDQCPSPYKVHCQVCGFRGYPTHRCPFCAKNESRRRETGQVRED